MNTIFEKSLKRNRILYILEANFEFLISILVNGSFLATLTKELGVSDGLTGILSSIISLGCLFQLISLSIRSTSVKKIVLPFSIINQVLFMLLYVIPLTGFEKQTKISLFVIMILLAYMIYNMVHPKKIDWLMSSVDEFHRGSFTANKEIVSLVSGMVFSLGMGTVIDYFSGIGKIRVAFTIAAVVMFVLMILHSFTMIFATEIKASNHSQKNLKHSIIELIKNKNVLRITVISLLYNASTYISTPFYGTYQIGELGLNLKFITAITMCESISRILVSRFWGSYADKKSFSKMIEKCFIFLALAQICIIFAVPSTGKIMFIIYRLLHGIAMGGVNSALVNLIFESVPKEKTADALAITQTIAGITGFLISLAASCLVTYVQRNGNSVFGIPIYAQQLLSIFALIITVLSILYTRCVLIKKK